MSEGSLGAPERHPIRWQDPEYCNDAKIDAELRRQFDVCHGCRRCHNLCDSFPRLFDFIDEAESMELDTVNSGDFKHVVDACTLCDMCFMTKCPYVPPHEFNLDLPHLMLRYRAAEFKKGASGFVKKQISETDRNGKIAGAIAPMTNWATRTENGLTRPVLHAVAGIDKNAALPKFHSKTLIARQPSNHPEVDTSVLSKSRKAVVYATCFINYNDPEMGNDALQVLVRNGVQTEVLHPVCCGMPKLEHGDIEGVAANARRVSASFKPWIEKGYDVIALTPSCSLMLKSEWPLILSDDENIKLLSGATYDLSEYIVEIAKEKGLADGMQPLDGKVTVHLACHSRAQNMGQKAAELLRLIPDAVVDVGERCSGHGGSWGMLKSNFSTAMKMGRPVVRKTVESAPTYVVSECPLAGPHILQGLNRNAENEEETFQIPRCVPHPIQLLAAAYRKGES